MIINLTQHEAAPDQLEQGLEDLAPKARAELKDLLTVSEEELNASTDGLFQQLIDARVSGIIALIWPRIMREHQTRAALVHDLHQQGDPLDAWNASREPLFSALIGGAPYLVDALKVRLIELGIKPVYATTARKSVEKTSPEGVVTKTQVFEHLRFRPAR